MQVEIKIKIESTYLSYPFLESAVLRFRFKVDPSAINVGCGFSPALRLCKKWPIFRKKNLSQFKKRVGDFWLDRCQTLCMCTWIWATGTDSYLAVSTGTPISNFRADRVWGLPNDRYLPTGATTLLLPRPSTAPGTFPMIQDEQLKWSSKGLLR